MNLSLQLKLSDCFGDHKYRFSWYHSIDRIFIQGNRSQKLEYFLFNIQFRDTLLYLDGIRVYMNRLCPDLTNTIIY